jgi:MurNAc alpha-1-phosphate uridylyltransferase
MAAMNDFRASGKLAQIWLVPNPPHNPGGDFGLTDEGLASNEGTSRLTYSTMGLYRHALVCTALLRHRGGQPARHQGTAGADAANAAMDQRQVSARRYTGLWVDVGTPQRLAQLNQVPDS